MNIEKKRFITATSVLVGTCIGAGVLAIPYVAAQTGFFVALAYILLVGALILIINLYLGEISLRTKGKHQLAGYAKKYLGKTGKKIITFVFVFGIYSAIIAYMFGIGESFSFLFFGNSSYSILFAVVAGLIMSWLIWRGLKYLKKFEKIGVGLILFFLVLISVVFFKDINISNLFVFNLGKLFLPLGVILFALMSFQSIPEINLVLKNKEHLMKRVIITGVLISIVFYILFALIVVGVKGSATPEIATLGLGKIFIWLGIFTMFTSYLSTGNALLENFQFDGKFKKKQAWFLTSIIPILIFLSIRMFKFFSFTTRVQKIKEKEFQNMLFL